MKVTLITLIIFYINYAYMLLIGGCFLYKGILMISTPFSVLFIFLVPIYITFIHLSISYIYKKIKGRTSRPPYKIYFLAKKKT